MSDKFLLISSHPDSLIKFRGPLIESLMQQGLELHVAVPNLMSDNTVFKLLSEKGVRIYTIHLQRTGINPLSDFITMVELYRLMISIKPRIVLGYTIKPVIYGSLAAWLARVPYRYALITGLGYAFTGQAIGKRGFLKKIIQRMYRFALHRVNKIFFQNPDDKKLFYQLGVIKKQESSIVVNGSGVNVIEYSMTPLPVYTSFLLISRFQGDKGVREYAKAAAIVKRRYPFVNFKLVGWIDDNPDAISQAELDEWVSSGYLDYLGKLSDVRPAIAKCSVYVLPSYREGTPRTVLEAMAMGRAIITTDAPGCRETVVNGDNGFLVTVQAVDELVDAMLRFIEDPELARQMGERSRTIAEQKYDVDKVNDYMLKEMGIKIMT